MSSNIVKVNNQSSDMLVHIIAYIVMKRYKICGCKVTATNQKLTIQVHCIEVNDDILVKMEVGIEDSLHIEFEYSRTKFHLRDVLIGKVFFLLVRIRIKHMEIALIRKEATGTGQNTYTDSETVTKYEIMDGAPVAGESIPIRLFLGGFDLTPTFKNINNKFSVKYYVNLVLVDEEDRRYFKSQVR